MSNKNKTSSNETKLSHFRIPPLVKNKLGDLAKVDNINMTAVLINLINAAHRSRAEEIKEFKKNEKLSASDEK